MKTSRSIRCPLAALLGAALLTAARAQDGSGLLLPFPAGSAADDAPAPHAAVPGRAEPDVNTLSREDAERARELAETFIRRQQQEVTHSVPRRGIPSVSVPARIAAPGPLLAATPFRDTAITSAGPSSELLPLPGDESHGAPVESVLPDAFSPPQLESVPESPASAPETEVPREDLVPAPAYGGVENQERTGPVFRVSGPQAYAVARARGFKFTPAGGIGSRDGMHTAASQFPNLLTSEVHGTRLSQLRPPAAWSVQECSNTFFMFCDANYNAVRLAPGWRIRGIRIEGPSWRWVACPRSGANTASFSVRVHAYKGQDTATSVQFTGLTLEGPEGATDWREAFPWINGKGPAPAAAPAPSALAVTPSQSAAPELPQ